MEDAGRLLTTAAQGYKLSVTSITDEADTERGARVDKVLDAQGVADELGIGRTTAYQVMRRPDFPALRIGRVYRVRRSDLERWWGEHSGGQVTTDNTGLGARRRQGPAPNGGCRP